MGRSSRIHHFRARPARGFANSETARSAIAPLVSGIFPGMCGWRGAQNYLRRWSIRSLWPIAFISPIVSDFSSGRARPETIGADARFARFGQTSVYTPLVPDLSCVGGGGRGRGGVIGRIGRFARFGKFLEKRASNAKHLELRGGPPEPPSLMSNASRFELGGGGAVVTGWADSTGNPDGPISPPTPFPNPTRAFVCRAPSFGNISGGGPKN